MPPISANVTNQQITASVGETKIDVAVSGGVGPTGSSGTVAVSAPITNAGTSSAAVIGLATGTGLAVSSGSLTVSYGNSAGTACQGNDPRLSDARTPVSHLHAIADVSGLQVALDNKQAAGSYAASVHTHTANQISDFTSAVIAAAPPTTNASLLTSGTLPDARLSSNIARTSDVTSAVAAVVNAAPASLDTLKELADALGNDANFASTVTNAIAGKAAAVHTHVIADVTGLQTALDGKQASGSYAAASHTHTIANVTGLQTALDGKQAAGSYAAAVHTHGISDVTGLQTALDGKAATSHGHAIADVTGLQTALDGKQAAGSYAAASHGHAIADVSGLQIALDGKAAASHTHTVAQVSGLQSILDSKYLQLNSAAYAIPTLVPLAVGTTGRPSYYGTYDQEGNVEEMLGTFGGTGRNDPQYVALIGGSFYSENFGGTYPITYRWLFMSPTYKSAAWGFRVVSLTDPNNYGGFVTVGDTGNSNNADGYGGVAYEYRIGKFCVTVGEWVAFLNAVAKTDTNGIFWDGTGSGSTGFPSQITRTGSSGSYVYAAVAGHSQRPAVFMRWTDAARYCNWLHNGKPTGAQGSGTTEGGAYTISSTTTVLAANADAKYRLPTESEWIKAGRYKGGSTNAGYWKFSTQSDDNPDKCVTDVLGSGLATVATSGSAADLTGTLNAARLPATAVTAGSYGSASSVGTFTVDAAGRLTTAGSTAIAISAGAVSGLANVATSGSYNDLTNKPTIPSAYTLPTASATVLGGVKIGSGLSIDGSSVLSTTYSYTLPNATTSTLGGVIVGTGLGVTSGTVSVSYGTTSGTACQGNDSRLSDARTPTSHASSHASGGSDAISIAASQITSGTIATARLGSGTADATTFLRGDGTYATPSASVTYATTAQAQDLTATTVAMNPANVRTAIRSFARVPYATVYTLNGGSAGSVNGNSITWSLTGGANANGSAAAYNSGNGFSGRVRQGYDWSLPAAFNVSVVRQTCPSTGIARFLFGCLSTPFSWATLDGRGIGFEIRQSRIWVLVHNGTTLSTTDSGIDTFSGDFQQEVVDIWIRSDGAGNVTLTRSLNGGTASSYSTTGGPSAATAGTSATAWAGVNNGSTASAANFIFSNHVVSVQ